MKTDKEKEIDNIFKRGLENSTSDQDHAEADWGAMEQLLGKQKEKPFIIYWLPVISSIAAMLLLFVGWWLFNPLITSTRQVTRVVTGQHSQQNIAKISPGKRLTVTSDTLTPNASISGKAGSIANNANYSAAGKYNKDKDHPVNQSFAMAGDSDKNAGSSVNENERRHEVELVAYNPAVVFTVQSQNNTQIIDPVNVSSIYNTPEHLSKTKPRSSFAYRPQLAISVLASSDKNGVNSFQQSKPGNNAGILFSVGLTKKLTISTGAIYSAKEYMTDFAGYHTNYQLTATPVSVLADCRMFDVPLNIDYQLFNKHRNKISVGTGFSSYLMLHENYQFNYAGYGSAPAKYNVPSPGKYLFSIMNIQATYTRQINSKVGLTLEPYVKLPLSAVGASEVKLQSTGIAVGLTWNLNSLSKN